MMRTTPGEYVREVADDPLPHLRHTCATLALSAHVKPKGCQWDAGTPDHRDHIGHLLARPARHATGRHRRHGVHALRLIA